MVHSQLYMSGNHPSAKGNAMELSNRKLSGKQPANILWLKRQLDKITQTSDLNYSGKKKHNNPYILSLMINKMNHILIKNWGIKEICMEMHHYLKNNVIQVNPISTNVIVHSIPAERERERVREHTWATYPSAVADLWTSFLSVKKLMILEGGMVNCRPKIVSDAWFTGLDLAEFPGKNILRRKTENKNLSPKIMASTLWRLREKQKSWKR